MSSTTSIHVPPWLLPPNLAPFTQLVTRRISTHYLPSNFAPQDPSVLHLGRKICMLSPQSRICFAELLSTISTSSDTGRIVYEELAHLLQEMLLRARAREFRGACWRCCWYFVTLCLVLLKSLEVFSDYSYWSS